MLDLLPVYSLTVLSCDLLPGTRVAPRGGGGWCLGLALLCTESSIAACQGPENTIK